LLGNLSNDSDSITVATLGNGGTGGGGAGTGGGSGGFPAVQQDKVTSTDGKLTLPVGRSGEVRLSDEMKIVIPAGASGEELEITVNKVANPQELIKGNEMLLSPVFEILTNMAGTLKEDVELTFAFDPTTIKGGQRPSIFFYDESKRGWVEIGGKVTGNTITASVNHFTKFAVFAVDEETESTPEAAPTIRFSDTSGHWAEAVIRAAADAGFVRGYADGTFKPNADITRAEFAVMLMHALKAQGSGTELMFEDRAKIGTWASEAIAQAVGAGIVNGYSDGTFRPTAKISRSELAVMIARAYSANIGKELSDPTGFSDDEDIPAWARAAVSAVREAGIVQGRSGNLFAPDATATRAEAVAMIMNLLQKMN